MRLTPEQFMALTPEERAARRAKRFNPDKPLKQKQLDKIQQKIDDLIAYIEATDVDDDNKELALIKVRRIGQRALNHLTKSDNTGA